MYALKSAHMAKNSSVLHRSQLISRTTVLFFLCAAVQFLGEHFISNQYLMNLSFVFVTIFDLQGDTTCGQRAIYQVGMTGIPIYNVNNACSTGSTALYSSSSKRRASVTVSGLMRFLS